jgi:hypothetical protein
LFRRRRHTRASEPSRARKDTEPSALLSCLVLSSKAARTADSTFWRKEISMNRLALLVASVVLAGCAAQASTVWVAPPPPPPPPPPPATVDVEAEPATAEIVAPPPEETAEPEELIATSEPPEMVYEEEDDAPSPGMVWIHGYWQWTGNDWAWFYGGWRSAPEGRVYVEPYYERVDDHVVYVRGYWGLRGAEPRYYGGDRIVFAVAVRPDGYRRGEHVPVPRSGGLPPGQRAGHYGPRPAGAKKRPLPVASAPRRPLSHGDAEHAGGAHDEHHGEHPEQVRSEPARAEPVHAEPERAHEPGPRAEPRPAPKPQPKPVSHPRKK